MTSAADFDMKALPHIWGEPKEVLVSTDISTLPLDGLLVYVDEPNQSACLRLLADHREIYRNAPGSRSKHQAWQGGYLDHIVGTMRYAIVRYWTDRAFAPIPFSLSSALLVLFLHDAEKPALYSCEGDTIEVIQRMDKGQRAVYRLELIKRYGIALSPDELNALKYVEGEGDDYDPNRNVMGPLAAFCHTCDVMSARVWHYVHFANLLR